MLRASSELATLNPAQALIVGSVDLVGYAVLAIGGVAMHFLGAALGLIIGGVAGFLVVIAWFSVSAQVDKNAVMCECEACFKQWRYGECTRSKAGART